MAYVINTGECIKTAISQKTLVALVVILSAAAGCVAGFGLNPSGSPTTWQGDPDFYNLLWQAILQIMSTYCSFATVLRNQRNRRSKHPTRALWDVTFYTFAVLSIAAAIMAPVAFVHFPGPGQTSSSATIINFASTVFALIPAVNLAASYNGEWYRRR